ncbi:nucleoid DNA-binding protein [Dysgonomonas sp. PFB1-18]|uniref:HU family DNA-binding protein n=1 Tax=unclassified Dysgonomonas TaxID=2630389 RepID=UPI002474617C|nr:MULTISPECIES: HU family DNA-binding protein [unclassified Dysgonomonas]MDH6309845.1 nucleoid DNA-binding protein [Dysgonomonas sp. PF1-14]MDH6339389.1 nucleoid DNA-binding protein [Dysgonomonas sp. PF1-16]MDH6380888.1 nucleoid DNA-binding protein [Dysgonomonas sp. PFB1-18]MDH6397897.1 nucleoid DNA-binding protein [Dysgonomonas sp. PF1-23]
MNERLSLQDLIDLLAKKQDLTKKDAETFLRELFTIVSETIEQNESVKIKDFGTFKLVKVNARKSVDVNTGEAIEIAAHYKLSFTPDKSLKEAINRPFAHFESVVLEEGVSFDNIELSAETNAVEAEDDADEAESFAGDEILIGQAVEEVLREEEIEITEAESAKEDNSTEKESIVAPAEEQILTAHNTEELQEQDKEEETADPQKQEETINEHNVPQGIINKIEEEALLKNVDKENIVLVVTEHEEETEEELLERKRKKSNRRKYISLGFFIFLIIAGFAVGALYFQEIARFLTTGPDGKSPKAVVADNNKPQDNNTIIADSLSSTAQRTDSSTAAKPVQQKPQVATPKAETTQPVPQQEKTSAPPASSTSTTAPLTTVTISPGHTLRNIALEHYGHKSFWVYIYEDNKNAIKNPNNVPLGTKLVLPNPAKYGIDPKNKESVDKAKAKESQLFTSLAQ